MHDFRLFEKASESPIAIMRRLIPPLTLLRLTQLWPHARKQGRERGQVYRVGYYCRHCGTDVVWLVDSEGQYNWTVDLSFYRPTLRGREGVF